MTTSGGQSRRRADGRPQTSRLSATMIRPPAAPRPFGLPLLPRRVLRQGRSGKDSASRARPPPPPPAPPARASSSPRRPASPLCAPEPAAIVLARAFVLHCCCVERGCMEGSETPGQPRRARGRRRPRGLTLRRGLRPFRADFEPNGPAPEEIYGFLSLYLVSHLTGRTF